MLTLSVAYADNAVDSSMPSFLYGVDVYTLQSDVFIMPLADVVPATASQVTASSLSPRVSSSSWGAGMSGIQYTMNTYYNGTQIGSATLWGNNVQVTSMTLSGNILSYSRTFTYNYQNNNTTTYSSGQAFMGVPPAYSSNQEGGSSAGLVFTFPAGIYSYQVVGSITVTARAGSGVYTTTIPMTQQVYNSVVPVSSCELKFNYGTAVQAVTLPGSGSVTVSLQIDLSGLSFYLNQTAESVLLTLPSGQYLNSSGNIVSGSNVPAYTYLTQGILGLSSSIKGSVDSWWYSRTAGSNWSGTVNQSNQNASILALLGRVTYNQVQIADMLGLNSGASTPYYSPGGVVNSDTNNWSAAFMISRLCYNTAYGFSDMWRSINSGLVGTFGKSYVAKLFEFGDEDSVLSKSETVEEYSNILEAIVAMYSGLQRPLSQLQAVLANDDELELRQQTEPEVDAVIDGFTGEGQGAPSVDQIGEMAGVSGQMGDLFNSGVTPSDMFNAATSGDSYSFFTQEVADALDTVGAVSTYSLDDHLYDLSDYELTEDGFYVLRDQSFFDLSIFLGRD